MKRVKVIGLIASHVVFGAIGILLAVRGADSASSGSQTSAVPSTAGPERSRPIERLGSVTSSQRPLKDWRGNEFARAWDAVRGAKLSTKDRIETQRQLLQAWARVDLAAAMRATLDEAWDDDLSEFFNPAGPLIGVFAEAFGEKPEEAWDLIQNGGFGLGTSLLRSVWIEGVGKKDPVHLASMIEQLTWRDREKALDACQFGRVLARNNRKLFQDLFDQLAALPADIVSSERLAHFLLQDQVPRNVSKLREELLLVANPDERLAGVKAAVMGRLLGSESHEEIASAIEGLPDKLQQDVLWSAYNWKQFETADEFTGMVDLLVAANGFDKLNQHSIAQQVLANARSGDAREIAEWVTTLPYRVETTQMFHRGVETYLRQNLADAREWISAIPSHEWQDRAYAEYSQQALNAAKDPAASRWALDQIRDPAFKAEAEVWRRNWEKRNAPPGE